MRTLSHSSLVEVLATWGEHEARGRKHDDPHSDIGDRLAYIDFALRSRAVGIAAILERNPQATTLVEFDPPESDAFVLLDGRSVDDWIHAARKDNGAEWAHFRRLVEGDVPPAGPLVASARFQPPQNSIGPITLWDGWHRAAAWRERCRNGRPSRISAFLILTRK